MPITPTTKRKVGRPRTCDCGDCQTCKWRKIKAAKRERLREELRNQYESGSIFKKN